MACRFRVRARRGARNPDPWAQPAPRGGSGAASRLIEPAGRLGRSRRLTVRLAMCVVVAVVLTAIVSTLYLGRLARQTLMEVQSRSAGVLTQTLAVSLAPQIEGGWGGSAEAVIDAVELDPRTSFIHVTDVHGDSLHRRVFDEGAWLAFSGDARRVDTAALGRPIRIDRGGDAPVVVQRSPVWNPPLRVMADRPTADRADRDLVGYVTLGMTDRSTAEMLVELRVSQVVVAGVTSGLLLPVVVFLLVRWLGPLRRLTEAVGELAEGRRPRPVPEADRDEVGLLGRGFNAMVERLFAAQADLEHANQRLEGEVARRTAQLESANQRLEAEVRDKDDFLRAVTHDLGAPVRNISGLASMLSAKYAGALADDAIRKLDRIHANAKRQTELIQDLLELSRIRTRPGRRERFAVGEVLDQLRDAFSYDLEHAGITLRVPEGLPVFFAERNRIRQVFQNLIDNAAKYMLDAPTRRITIEYNRDEHHHFFAVADTGRGIADEDLADVFQVFRRASHSGTERVPGKGVGLASVKTIVEAYGGWITVHSKLGSGTRFDFSFAQSAVREEPEASESGTGSGEPRAASDAGAPRPTPS